MNFLNNGNLLSTRTDGEKYREVLVKEFENSGMCEIDFAKIKSITPSFADELFAKLAMQIGVEKFLKGVTIKNANAEIKSTIIFAINNRKEMDARDACANHLHNMS